MSFPVALQNLACVSLDFFNTFATPPIVTYTAAAGDNLNPDVTCLSQCQGYFFYGFQQISLSQTDQTLKCGCFGAGAFPDPPNYVEALSNQAQCSDDSASFYLQAALFPVERNPTCYAVTDFTGYTDARSQIGCFYQCNSVYYTAYAYVVPDPVNDINFKCGCFNEPPPASQYANCQRGVAFVHKFITTPVPPNQPSTPVKRSKMEKEKVERRRKMKDERYCPRGTVACNILGSTEAYECIDTQEELESCGGCVHGTFGAFMVTSSGTDCTRLPGVSPHGVSCADGKCRIKTCQEGFIISDGQCVPSIVFQDWDT